MKIASLVLSVLAFVAAVLALSKTPGPLLSMGSGMDAYDFSSPEAAWRSGKAIQDARDVRAMVELGSLVGEEARRTSKLEDVVPFEDRYVLFLSMEVDGKPKFTTQGMKKLPGTDVWVQDYIAEYKVRGKDKNLAERMSAWEKRSKK